MSTTSTDRLLTSERETDWLVRRADHRAGDRHGTVATIDQWSSTTEFARGRIDCDDRQRLVEVSPQLASTVDPPQVALAVQGEIVESIHRTASAEPLQHRLHPSSIHSPEDRYLGVHQRIERRSVDLLTSRIAVATTRRDLDRGPLDDVAESERQITHSLEFDCHHLLGERVHGTQLITPPAHGRFLVRSAVRETDSHRTIVEPVVLVSQAEQPVAPLMGQRLCRCQRIEPRDVHSSITEAKLTPWRQLVGFERLEGCAARVGERSDPHGDRAP